MNQTSLFTTFLHIRNFTWEAVEGSKNYFTSEGLASVIQALCRSPNLMRCILTVSNIFVITVSNLRCLRLRDVAELEVNPIFFLTTAHSIFQFDEVNSKDEISSPWLLYLDSLEIQVVYIFFAYAFLKIPATLGAGFILDRLTTPRAVPDLGFFSPRPCLLLIGRHI